MRVVQARFVEIINTSDTPRELRDSALGVYPDDRVTLGAKEKRRVPVATFLRVQHLPYIMRAERYEAMLEGTPAEGESRPRPRRRAVREAEGEQTA